MDDLSGWRARIDEIDRDIVRLLNERARCALEIGAIKAGKGIDIYNPERESAVMDNVRSHNKGPLSDEAVLRVFSAVVEECRAIE